ncbi:MAG: phosphopantetheine-binding protein, partial [Chromatiales bacterium]
MCASGPRRSTEDSAPERAKVLLGLVELLLADLHPGRPAARVTLDSTLDRDLGIDSLGRMELLARIEREFGVTLPDRLFAEANTPRDLARALHTAAQWKAGPETEARSEAALASVEAEPVPARAQTLIEATQWHAQRQPEREHIHLLGEGDTAEAISYGRLWAQARGIGAGLQREGLLPGETVLLMLPTSLDYFRAFLGTVLAGGIPVPIYPPARASQLEDHLRRQVGIATNCRAAMMITVPAAQRVARLLRHGVASLRTVATTQDLSAPEAGLTIPPVG